MTKILLADDEHAITAELGPFLQGHGFDVAIARDGAEALELAAFVQPDLIVLDVLMPKLDGRSVCRRLRQEGNGTPVIMLTQAGRRRNAPLASTKGPTTI